MRACLPWCRPKGPHTLGICRKGARVRGAACKPDRGPHPPCNCATGATARRQPCAIALDSEGHAPQCCTCCTVARLHQDAALRLRAVQVEENETALRLGALVLGQSLSRQIRPTPEWAQCKAPSDCATRRTRRRIFRAVNIQSMPANTPSSSH